MGGGGVKNNRKLRNVIYGRPTSCIGFFDQTRGLQHREKAQCGPWKMRCFDKEEILYLLRAAMTNFEFDTHEL